MNESLKQKEASGKTPLLQWHPAFYAGIQIEFGAEAQHLTFESEHLLGSKPMQIDIIVKNEQNKTLKKNIERIFRKYNIIEYKGPGDYLSIDDFYKVYGYTWFYKSDTRAVDSIKIHELTITLVSQSYPQKLIQHLQQKRGYAVKRTEPGIYRVIGDVIPIQILVTRRMTQKKNLWLRNLTDHIQNTEDAQELLKEYKKHKTDKLYESVMDTIMKSNFNLFKEMETMCEALRELMKDELEERERIAKEDGKKEGEEFGETRVNQLNQKLISLNRFDDIVKSVSDKLYQKKLFAEFHL